MRLGLCVIRLRARAASDMALAEARTVNEKAEAVRDMAYAKALMFYEKAEA